MVKVILWSQNEVLTFPQQIRKDYKDQRCPAVARLQVNSLSTPDGREQMRLRPPLLVSVRMPPPRVPAAEFRSAGTSGPTAPAGHRRRQLPTATRAHGSPQAPARGHAALTQDLMEKRTHSKGA